VRWTGDAGDEASDGGRSVELEAFEEFEGAVEGVA
jgi:hypothetical protein